MKYLRKYNESVDEVTSDDIKKILEINLEEFPVDNIKVLPRPTEYTEERKRVSRYDIRFEADLSDNEEVAKYCRISRDTWAIFIRDANNKLAKEAALDIYKARIDRLSKKYDFIASNWVIDIDSNVSPQGWFRLTFVLEPLNISGFK
jgi:vacuolar-type H+-ATPase subunit C/Vma6